MKIGKRKKAALGLVLIIAGALVATTLTDLVSFGSFPERDIGKYENRNTYRSALESYGYKFENKNYSFENETIEKILENKPENFGSQSISRRILFEAPTENGTGAANTVTGILWDYRGYDTIGEATVIFVAVAGVAALFRITRKEEEE